MNTKTLIQKKEFINFLQQLGININTHTKARGHQGIFVKNRIDVSKILDEQRQVQVMAHEFAHYIHSKIEPDMNKSKGHLENIFKTDDVSKIEQELKNLTLEIDENARLLKLKNIKKEIILRINRQEFIIKQDYPNFQRSKKFIEFEKYIKKSHARFLLKYDKVRIITPFLRREKFYTTDTIEHDFPDMNQAFCAYIRMNSLQRKRRRVSERINRYTKYYNSPAELFARFIESFFTDVNITRQIAPNAFYRFFELLSEGYYFEMKSLFRIAGIYN